MPDNQPCDLVSQCFLLTVPFRGMLLTPQGGPRCLAPTAHQIPVYLMVFSTFLCRAFTAQYLYTPRYCYISPLCFTAQRRLQVHDRFLKNFNGLLPKGFSEGCVLQRCTCG